MRLRPKATTLVCEGKMGGILGKRGYTVGRSYSLKSQKDNDLGVRAVAANVIELDLASLTDHQAHLAGFENRGEAFQWYRERHERIPEPASRAEPPKATYKVYLTLLGLDKTHRYRLLGKSPGHDYVETPYLALSGVDPNDPGEAPERSWLNSNAEDARDRWERDQNQQRFARLVQPPEQQLADELEALRRESPGDAWRYEAQAVALAEKIRKKRMRRAA